ncbi:MAG: DNA/RNA non-specific endonuclease, partial [Bacteroidetes bacterium]|nr:DNA/RNA non-specific endonuclease [Bacteroidota bacterium]
MKNAFLMLMASLMLISTGCKKSDSDIPQEPVAPTTPPVVPPVVPPVTPPATMDGENESLFLGNPSNATADVSNPDNYLMNSTYYGLSYNDTKATPNWVSWHVMPSDLGSVSRADDFRANESLPTGWFRADNFSYSGSGFDRGHMCPSADRNATADANSSTFLMTNIVPQAPTNNQVTWANLETYCRNLVLAGNELYIIAGVHGTGGTGNNGFAEYIAGGRITVPAYVWKTILVLPNGSNDLSRINSSTRVISVFMPNQNSTGSNWKAYRVSVRDIEAATGYDFYSKLPQSLQDVIETQVDNL